MYTEDELAEYRRQYYHHWISYKGVRMYVKYVFIDEHDMPHFSNLVFLGRDCDNNYVRLDINRDDIGFEENIIDDLN